MVLSECDPSIRKHGFFRFFDAGRCVLSRFDSTFADEFSIDTPEQVELRLPLAGIGSRMLAMLVDSLVQGAATLVLLLILVLVAAALPSARGATAHAGGASEAAGKWVIAGMILVQFLLIWGYFSLFEAFWNGQTPGKRLLRIRVLQDSGRPITLFESMSRNLLRIIDMLPTLYAVGLVTMLCNRENKRLGDLLAGTLVVHERDAHAEPFRASATSILSPAASIQVIHNERLSSDGNMVPADAAARLDGGDRRVIETFLARNLDLPVDVRHAMAVRIAESMTAKMGWFPEGFREHPEWLLESLLGVLRDR